MTDGTDNSNGYNDGRGHKQWQMPTTAMVVDVTEVGADRNCGSDDKGGFGMKQLQWSWMVQC